MRNRLCLNNLFSRDRRVLYIILSIVMISILTLTVVYAALSTTLNINGNAEVTAASWDIHFDNIQINSGSVTATKVPTIVDSRIIDFAVSLKEPGDYYKFSVDIVNDGTIDAMIDSVVKTPELTSEQAKYIKYEIEYTDGNSINSKQLLSKDETRTISVLVAYRSDVASNDIPTEGDSLNLSFMMIYNQADETGTEIPESTPVVRVVNGDLDTIGSEIVIGNEHFYLISSDDKSVTMLAKYNLYVGTECSSSTSCIPYGAEATGIQDSAMLGYPIDGSYPRKGATAFSSENYWSGTVTTYPAYVYDLNSTIYPYIENYRHYLEEFGTTIMNARLISVEELESLGCSLAAHNCKSSQYLWVYSTSYWTGGAFNIPIAISSIAGFDSVSYIDAFGVRPVIKISKSEF